MKARPAPATRIELQPPSSRARTWSFLLTVGVPLVALAASRVLQPTRWHAWLGGGWPWAGGAIALAVPTLVVIGVWIAMRWALRRHRIEMEGDRFTVIAGFHRDPLALSDLLLEQARVGTLGEHPEWKPFLKSNGMAVPGFRGGWFRTRRWQRVFACIADGDRLLWIPTLRKHALLLDARQPRELLERLRAMATPPPRR